MYCLIKHFNNKYFCHKLKYDGDTVIMSFLGSTMLVCFNFCE